MEYDLHRNIKIAKAGASGTVIAGIQSAGSTTGGTVDTRGFRSCIFVIDARVSAGGMTIDFERSDDGSAWESVPLEDILGGDPAQTLAGRVGAVTADGVVTFSLRSNHRYQRIVFTDTGSASIIYGAFAILGDPIAAETVEQGDF